MHLRCPHCGAQYRVGDDKVKSLVRVRCPKCQAVFHVRPKAPAPEAKSGADKKTDKFEQPEKRQSLVIIEDARYFRELIRDVLSPLALEIHEAEDGRRGLEMVRKVKPDLVILDLNLPHLNGYELMRAIRADENLEKTRLLAMSGVYRKEPDQRAAQEAGADEFIGKSFTPDFLLEQVKRLLRARS